MSTAVDLPEVRALQAARHVREARIKFWRVLVVTAFFVVVVGGNLFVGAVVVVGAFRTQAEQGPSNNRLARIAHPLLDGTFCRYTIYDNQTAQTVEDKVSRCDGRDRNFSGKGRSGFIWGGK